MVQILPDLKLDFDDVLILPKRTKTITRSEVDLQRNYEFLHSEFEYKGIPIVASNMDTIGTFKMATILHGMDVSTALHKHYTIEQLSTFFRNSKENMIGRVWVSMGMTQNDYDKMKELMYAMEARNIDIGICVDVANGYQETFVDMIRAIRKAVATKYTTIMAGNVVTKEMTEALLLAGADIVKVGIGPGSVCTTRTMTGVGYPQLSAILECADAAHGLGGHICADGGCRTPADVAKAFAAGADFVMLGGMLSGHYECDGEFLDENGLVLKTSDVFDAENLTQRFAKTMRFYGMSSQDAMDKHYGGKAAYRAAEGKTVEVPYKGPVSNTIETILGGIRSTCTYTGSKTLKELSKRATMIRVSRQKNDVFGTN